MGPACSVMKIILVLWLSSVPVQTSIIRQALWYKPYPRTWMEARANCRSEHNGDLAMDPMNEVKQMDMSLFHAWIGLRKNGSKWFWHKAAGVVREVQDDFSTPNGNKECGKAVYGAAVPLDDDCKNLHFFFCTYYDNYYYWTIIFVPKTKTWEEAKAYCEEKNSQFTTITYNKDLLWKYSPFYSLRDFPVWIGHYQNGDCGVVGSKSKSWSYKNCSEAFPFLCSTHNLRLVQELLTWEESYHHCKSHAPDSNSTYQLVSVDTQDLTFIHFVASNATTDKVWLGLRFIGGSWFWSDGAVLSLPDLPSCPEPNRRCGALVVNRLSSTSELNIELSDCSEKLNLLCYGTF